MTKSIFWAFTFITDSNLPAFDFFKLSSETLEDLIATFFLNLLFIILILITFNTSSFAKRAAIIIDYDTNQTLFEVNANTLNYPASLVKMMTLYMTFEALENGALTWDQKLKVSETAASRSPSKLYLEVGSYITVGDAVMALIINYLLINYQKKKK